MAFQIKPDSQKVIQAISLVAFFLSLALTKVPIVLLQLLGIPHYDNLLSLSLWIHKLLCGVPHFGFIYQIKNTYLHFQGHHTLFRTYLHFSLNTKLSPSVVCNCNLICWVHFETNNSTLSHRNSKIFSPAVHKGISESFLKDFLCWGSSGSELVVRSSFSLTAHFSSFFILFDLIKELRFTPVRSYPTVHAANEGGAKFFHLSWKPSCPSPIPTTGYKDPHGLHARMSGSSVSPLFHL